MFLGHFGLAYATKRWKNEHTVGSRVSLAVLFLAADGRPAGRQSSSSQELKRSRFNRALRLLIHSTSRTIRGVIAF